MMNKTITSLAIACLLSTFSLFTFAAEKSAAGVIQPQAAETNEEKANKNGEEASGSNSGADAQAIEKDAATSSDSKDQEKTK